MTSYPTDLLQDSALLQNHSIITPPNSDHLKELRTRRVRILLDSRDRNYDVYPNPAKYRIDLDEDVRDVVSVQLIAYNIPFSDFNITSSNNLFHVLFHNVTYTLTIPPGKYDGEELAQMLNNLVDYDYQPHHDQDTPTSQILTRMPILPLQFTFLPNTQKFTIHHSETDDAGTYTDAERTCVCRFARDTSYMPKTVARTLGFAPNDVSLVIGENPVRAPHPADLRPDTYIVMFLDSAKLYVSNNPGVNQSFAVLYRDVNDEGNSVLATDISKRFAKPLPQLKQISVSLRSRTGELYDFQNKEHCIELVYTCYRQTIAYDAIFKPAIVS